MKKIFLVDDEVIIREGIRQCIDWELEGFEYCGDASDGELALPLIEKHRPDIVITDIKMPFMDGLEISRILRKKHPHIKIIILSGHDEFDYAREALRIQVDEFCLKPLSSEDLLKVLHNISLQIDQEHENEQRLLALKERANQNEFHATNKFLYELCTGIYSTSEAFKIADRLNVELVSNFYFVLIIESERIPSKTIEWITNHTSHLQFQLNYKETIFIMKGDVKAELESLASRLKMSLLKESSQSIQAKLLFGLGNIKERIRGISLSFAEANEEKSYNHLVLKYHLEEEDAELFSAKRLHLFDRQALIEFLKFGNKESVSQFVHTYTASLREPKNHIPFLYFYFMMNVTLIVTDYIDQQKLGEIDSINQIKKMEISFNRY